MCIRDSPNSGCGHLSYHFPFCWFSVGQTSLRSFLASVIPIFGFQSDACIDGFGCLNSVSYTHLDVYKRQILDSVCQSVRKGGIIVYSTCTIMGKDNFEVVDQFLKNHPNFEQVPLDHERKDILKNDCILITPELYGSDGFFISRFKRIS